VENVCTSRYESSSARNPLVIACGADDRFTVPLAVTLYSALIHLSEESPASLYLVDGGISEKNRRRLNSVVESAPSPARVNLSWITPDLTPLRDLRVQRWLTGAAYLRLLLPDVLPEPLEKVLYLDSDLVVRRSLQELWNVGPGDCAIRAVQEFGQPYAAPALGLSRLGITKHEELGIKPDAPCFNSGVMLVNLKRWREENVSDRALSYLREYAAHLNCHDQEGLNVALHGEWGQLDPRWNRMSQIYALEHWPETPFKEQIRETRDELIRDPYIVHYNGRTKPWKFNGLHPAHGLFFDALGEVERLIEA